MKSIACSVKAAAVCGIVALSGAASAEPDVTWGDCSAAAGAIIGYGPVGGIRAYSFETYTCNGGDASLLWLNDGTPAIGFNGYRLFNGRFQQIGLGWCKTACCAANTGDATHCGFSNCSSTGFGLHAGCRDYYGSGYNAIQTNLSPRSGINAFTGTFSPIPTGTFNVIDRKMQITESDMNPVNFPGAVYFMEGQYVATDETLPGNKNNNCSYLRVDTSAAYAMTPVAGTFARGHPAIEAWRLNGLGAGLPDTRVEDGVLDVPGEGRFLHATKVTDLGNGTFRYDYAVFNQNSHRSGGGLRIPVPAGVQVSNIGFSDVPYHSGEPFSGTDWVGAKVGNEIVWQTEPYASNANANAIRWGTMYNFWFETTSAPQLGVATMDLFRPGTPTNVSFSTHVPSGPPGCAADFNHADGVTVQDIYDFLAQWQSANPVCDFNGINGVTVQDIYDFATAWSVGCS